MFILSFFFYLEIDERFASIKLCKINPIFIEWQNFLTATTSGKDSLQSNFSLFIWLFKKYIFLVFGSGFPFHLITTTLQLILSATTVRICLWFDVFENSVFDKEKKKKLEKIMIIIYWSMFGSSIISLFCIIILNIDAENEQKYTRQTNVIFISITLSVHHKRNDLIRIAYFLCLRIFSSSSSLALQSYV